MANDKVLISNRANDLIDTASREFWSALLELAVARAVEEKRNVVEQSDVDAVLEAAFAEMRSRHVKGTDADHAREQGVAACG